MGLDHYVTGGKSPASQLPTVKAVQQLCQFQAHLQAHLQVWKRSNQPGLQVNPCVLHEQKNLVSIASSKPQVRRQPWQSLGGNFFYQPPPMSRYGGGLGMLYDHSHAVGQALATVHLGTPALMDQGERG